MSLGKELISFLNDLMCAAYQIYIVVLKEVRHHISSEDETHSSLIFRPTRHALLRISPQQIAEQALIWHLERSNQLENLFKIIELRTDAAMHAEYLLIDDGTNRHDIEHIREGLPQLDVVLPLT